MIVHINALIRTPIIVIFPVSKFIINDKYFAIKEVRNGKCKIIKSMSTTIVFLR